MATRLPSFQGLDPYKPLHIYHRNLPHLRQDGATYFVTFRLADSIPPDTIRQWQNERKMWFRANGLSDDLPHAEWQARWQKIPMADRAAFDRHCGRQILLELDACHGKCVLRDDNAAAIVADALRYFDEERYRCGDFCIMPNHVHWLALPLPGYDLENILQSIKGYAARKINIALDRCGTLWQHESYDRLVRDGAELLRTREYIRNNPKGLLAADTRIWQCKWLDSVESINLDP